MRERIDLAVAHPLAAPFALFVEPTNLCNFKCGICPESLLDYGKQAGYLQTMSWAVWHRIAQSFSGWESLRVIRFFNIGEPLLNRDLDLMIDSARGFSERTEITTNASLLNSVWADRLIAAKLDYIRVSVYGTTKAAYEKETGQSRWDHNSIRANVMKLRELRGDSPTPHIHADLVSQESNFTEFWRQWDGVADSLSKKEMYNWGGTFTQLGEPRSDKVICPYPFYQLVVKSNGDVTVCCGDWKGQLTIGNVMEESLRELWEGPKLAAVREQHMAGKRCEIEVCKDCNIINTCPDNIDSLLTTGVLNA